MVRKLKQFDFHDCVKKRLLRKVPPSEEKAEGSMKAAGKWLEEAEKDLDGEAFNSSHIVLSHHVSFCKSYSFFRWVS